MQKCISIFFEAGYSTSASANQNLDFFKGVIMTDRTRTGIEIIEVSLLIGILGDALLRATPWGLNFFLWIAALVGAMTLLTYRRRNEIWSLQSFALHGALIFFSAMYMWQDSDELRVFDFFAIVAIFSVLMLPALKIPVQFAGIAHYAFGAFWSGINAALSPFFLLGEDIKWNAYAKSGWTKYLAAVFRGAIIAAPIIFVFGALFVAADAAFEGIVKRAFDIPTDAVVVDMLWIGVIFWLVAGYLRGAIHGFPINGEVVAAGQVVPENPTSISVTQPTAPKESNSESTKAKTPPKTKIDWRDFDNTLLPKTFTVGVVETSVILGAMNLLFGLFVALQLPYLFGGMELVQSTPDFKLAEYARRGFGELVMVSFLVLPVLLTGHWLLRKDSKANTKVFGILAGIQIGLLFVIMISAAQRLLLLTGNLGYGLTTTRFYPMAFMSFLALVFVWFCLTVLRGERRQFAWGSLWLGLFTLASLHVFNPDDFIARTNIRLMHEGRKFDAHYNRSLSNDAIPALLEGFSSMSFENQCIVGNGLSGIREKFENENFDLRSWNYSRSTARQLLNDNLAAIDLSSCPVEAGL